MNFDNLQKRFDDLRANHPGMIYRGINCFLVYVYGSKPERRYGLGILCPCTWTVWPDPKRVQLSSCYTIIDGDYTRLGLARKISELEKMDWEKFDAYAQDAAKQKAELEKEVAAFFKAACAPVKD